MTSDLGGPDDDFFRQILGYDPFERVSLPKVSALAFDIQMETNLHRVQESRSGVLRRAARAHPQLARGTRHPLTSQLVRHRGWVRIRRHVAAIRLSRSAALCSVPAFCPP